MAQTIHSPGNQPGAAQNNAAPPSAAGQDPVIKKKRLAASPQHHGAKMMEIDIEYPQVIIPGNMALTVAINHYYISSAQKRYAACLSGPLAEEARSYASQRQQKAPFHPSKFTARFNAPFKSSGYLSVYTDFSREFGEAPLKAERSAETWCLSSGRIMKFDDFFTTSAFLTMLYPGIIRKIEELNAREGSVFLNDFQKGVFLHFNSLNYWLSDEGFNLFFPQGSIAREEAGIISIPLPYQNFAGLYAKRMRPK